jgi:hypothetical protein
MQQSQEAGKAVFYSFKKLGLRRAETPPTLAIAICSVLQAVGYPTVSLPTGQTQYC